MEEFAAGFELAHVMQQGGGADIVDMILMKPMRAASDEAYKATR